MSVDRHERRPDLISALRLMFLDTEPDKLAEQTAAWLDDEQKRAVERFRTINTLDPSTPAVPLTPSPNR